MGCGCGKKKTASNTNKVTKTVTPKASNGVRRTRRIIRKPKQ